MPNALFNPAPERTLLLIDELLDPDLSLREVAARHNTSLAALSLWIASDETSQTLDALRTGYCDRIRTIAAANISPTITTINRILKSFNSADLSKLTPSELDRSHAIALRAASLFIRIAALRPTRTPQQRISTPIPVSPRTPAQRATPPRAPTPIAPAPAQPIATPTTPPAQPQAVGSSEAATHELPPEPTGSPADPAQLPPIPPELITAFAQLLEGITEGTPLTTAAMAPNPNLLAAAANNEHWP